MDIETAEKIISEQSLMLSNATEKCSRHPMTELLVAARTIQENFIRVRDERDDARRDACEIALLLKTSAEQLCLERGGVPDDYGVYDTAIHMLEKYKDAK